MAAPTKTGLVVQASTSVAAGGTQDSAARSVSGKFGALVSMKVTNGATGPTVGCNAIIQVRHSATGDWYIFRSFRAKNADNAVSEFTRRVPPETYEYRTRFTEHTGQAVTVVAEATELDSIS